MKKLKFKKIDAFATEVSNGNPAGYVRLEQEDSLTLSEMQKISKELKGFVNEVGFVYRENDDTFKLKYFSSEKEVDFCGHATIAIFYDLILEDQDLRKREKIFIVTNKGALTVYNKILTENAVFISAPVPEYRESFISKKEIVKALKISEQELEDDYPVNIINAGLETLIVPLKTMASVLNINPDFQKLKDFCISNCLDIIEIFTKEVSGQGNSFRTRVFAPVFGYLEDPATGSGNAAFGYYLMLNDKWQGEPISIEQNGYLDKYNIVKLRTLYEDGRTKVLFGGSSFTKIDGVCFI